MLAYILIAIIILTIYRGIIDIQSEAFVSDVTCTSKDNYNEVMNKYILSAKSNFTSGSLANHALTYMNDRTTPLDMNNLTSFNNNLANFYNNCLSDIENKVSNTENEFITKFKDHI